MRKDCGLSQKTLEQGSGALTGGWCFHIADMATLPQFQGRGLGRQDLDAPVAQIRSRTPDNPYATLVADLPGRRLCEQADSKKSVLPVAWNCRGYVFERGPDSVEATRRWRDRPGRPGNAGARRSPRENIADLEPSCPQLEEILTYSAAARRPNEHALGVAHYLVSGCPAHRLGEAEMHHVNLGLGYTPPAWPDGYVAWDLPELLSSMPERLGSAGERRRFMAWQAGRGPLDAKSTQGPGKDNS